MGNIPPPPPREWIEVTCLEDTERRFILGMDIDCEADPRPLNVDDVDPRWRIERNDRMTAETLRQNRQGTALLLLLVVVCVLAGLGVL